MTHSFNIDIAAKYGIEEAILFNHFVFWIKRNENEQSQFHFHDGKYWTYNTAKSLTKDFPYMSENVIKRHLTAMIENGLLIKGNFNPNPYDRTSWYALSDYAESIVQNDTIHFADLHNGKDNSAQSYTDNTSDIITDNKENNKENLELFEQCWVAYNRKGSKAKAKEYFLKLKESELPKVLPHIEAYVSSRDIQYQKDFERYLRDKIFLTIVYGRNNVIIYDPENPLPENKPTSIDGTPYQSAPVQYQEPEKVEYQSAPLPKLF